MSNILKSICDSAASKPAFSALIDTEESYRRVIPEPQVEVRRLSLRTLTISDVLNSGPDQILPAPGNTEKINRVAADVIQMNSRAVAAGARIILIGDAPYPVTDSIGTIKLVERPAGYIVSEPAAFSYVADGANISDSDVPVFRALIDRSVAPGYAFRTVLSRRQQKSFFEGELENGVLLSILAGLGRMVDQALLNAILADTPSEFSIGAAAARGLKIASLRALVGTDGAGATFRADGVLNAAGVSAELTGDMEETIVGDFSRAAIGVFEDITLLAHRTTTDGAMAVTAIANADALLPVKGSALPFWVVSES